MKHVEVASHFRPAQDVGGDYNDYFIRAVVRVLDFQERRLRLARAGHNHPLHFYARSGQSDWVQSYGVGIGMKKKSAFDGLLEELRVPLDEGDILVFYTETSPRR